MSASPPGGSKGIELERFRSYLLMLAELRLDSKLRGKVDLSGVVQQTLWEAAQSPPSPGCKTVAPGAGPGRDPGGDPSGDPGNEADGSTAACPARLRRILANNLVDAVRRATTAGRDVTREQSLHLALEDSSARLEALAAAEQSSPSQKAIRQEQVLQLVEALGRLPEAQRQAVQMHHLQGKPMAEIAAALGRSEGAVGALLVRGLKRLRELLKSDESDAK